MTVTTSISINGGRARSGGGYEVFINGTSGTISGLYTATSSYQFQYGYVYNSFSPIVTLSSWGTNIPFTDTVNILPPNESMSYQIYCRDRQPSTGTSRMSVYVCGPPRVIGSTAQTTIRRGETATLSNNSLFRSSGAPNSSYLSLSSTYGTCTMSSMATNYVLGGVVVFTPDVGGTYTNNITLTDTYYTECSSDYVWTIVCYEPPTVSFTPTTYTPERGETVLFTNTSDEQNSGPCLYTWYDNGVAIDGYVNVPKSSSLIYTFNNYANHEITLRGWDTGNSSVYNEASHQYACESHIGELTTIITPQQPRVNEQLTIECTSYKSDVTYKWYIGGIEIGTGRYCYYTPTTIGNHSIKLTAEYGSEYDEIDIGFDVLSSAPIVSFTYSPTTIYDGATKVYLVNTSEEVSGTTPTYTWKLNDDVFTPIIEGDKQYFIPEIGGTGSATITLSGSVDGYTNTNSETIVILSPAPVLTLSYTPNTPTYGNTVYCSLDVVGVVGSTYTISWKLNGVEQVGQHNDTFSFVVYSSQPTTYSVQASATVTNPKKTWTSQSNIVNVTTIEYKDSIKRYSIVIRNGNNAIVCTRSTISPNRFNNLQFEKRLNETGSGSFDLLMPSQNNSDSIASGSDIIIYDNYTPIYYGVVTQVNDNNINPLKINLSKKYYSIDFSEGCRKLSYLMCQNDGIYTEKYSSSDNTVNNLFKYIVGSDYIGSVDDNENKYTFSISYNDMLSQIDSLGEQCGARYRTNIYEYCNFNDAEYYNENYVVRNGGFGVQIPSGSIVFCKNESAIVVCVLRNAYTTTSYPYLETTELFKCGNVSRGDKLSISVIKQNPVIDFKQTYYQENSVLPVDSDVQYSTKNALIINKKTYGVDDVDSLNRHYGSISCVSQQSSGKNITRKININNEVGKDYSIQNVGYITDSKDSYIVEVGKYYSPTTLEYYYYYVIDGTYSYGTNNLYIPTKQSTSSTYSYESFDNIAISYSDCTYIDSKGVVRTGSKVLTLSQSLPLGWTDNSFIGAKLLCSKITYVSDTNELYTETNVSIAGDSYFAGSRQSLGNDKYSFMLDVTDIHPSLMLSFPNGTMIMKSYPTGECPYNLYPQRTLSVTLQSNMSYGDVGLLASNIARYGSNYSKNISGTCAIRNFITSSGKLPMVGDHVALYYNDGSVQSPQYPIDYKPYYHDYELQSFTVNTQTMTVDYVMGMKPINIGDVVYRITQNMTTNITTN